VQIVYKDRTLPQACDMKVKEWPVTRNLSLCRVVVTEYLKGRVFNLYCSGRDYELFICMVPAALL